MTDTDCTTPEVWKPIPDYPGYEVSDQGRVRSFVRVGGRGRNSYLVDFPRILKQHPHKDTGRLMTHIRKPGMPPKTVKVHTLVLISFVGPCPPGLEACHGKGGYLDNRPENLRWDTHANNMAEAVERNEMVHGENHPDTKLSDAEVVEIRTRFDNGERGFRLAREFRTGPSNIQQIVYGVTRRHAGGPIQSVKNRRLPKSV